MGGFESSTHRGPNRERVDVIQGSGHDVHCAEDYALLAGAGIYTVRDALRWHLIETVPYAYDWKSFLPMLNAAREHDLQMVWDLCHWGIPDGLDPFSPDFIARFAAFAKAAAIQICESDAASEGSHFYCPINEMSFWSWVGGDEEHFFPFGRGRARELKQQLVRASLAAMRSICEVDTRARFIQAEPIISITEHEARPEDAIVAAGHTAAQFEVWDMLAGKACSEVGGTSESLDILGVNYYWNNQWIHGGERTPLGHNSHTPLHELLETIWNRYERPIVLTETGVEGSSGAGWLGYVCAEVRRAQRAGVPVLGICLYPVMDYPGWTDDRHCSCGLIACSPDWSKRWLRTEYSDELRFQRAGQETR